MSVCFSEDKVKQSSENNDNNQQIIGNNNNIENNATTYNIEEYIVNSLPDNKEIPEFDGAYIKTNNNKYIELEEKKYFHVQIHKGGDVMDVINTPRTYYVADKKGIMIVKSNDFKGIVIRGKYEFKHFSLHPLVERTIQKGEGVLENNGPAMKRSKPIYIAGSEMKIRKKSLDNKTYFFLPPKIKNGEYVAWIGKIFWLFKIKN